MKKVEIDRKRQSAMRRVSFFIFSSMIILIVFLHLSDTVCAAGSFTGTVVPPANLADGDYLIISAKRHIAMTANDQVNPVSGHHYLSGVETDAFTDNTATVSDASAVWTYDSTHRSFKNKAAGQYLRLGEGDSMVSDNWQALATAAISGSEGTVYCHPDDYAYLSFDSSAGRFQSNRIAALDISPGSGVYFCLIRQNAADLLYQAGQTYDESDKVYDGRKAVAEAGSNVTFNSTTFSDCTFDWNPDAFMKAEGGGLVETFAADGVAVRCAVKQNGFSAMADTPFSAAFDLSDVITKNGEQSAADAVSVQMAEKSSWCAASAEGSAVTFSGTPTVTGTFPLAVISARVGEHDFAIPLWVQVDESWDSFPKTIGGETLTTLTVAAVWSGDEADSAAVTIQSGKNDVRVITLNAQNNWRQTIKAEKGKTYDVTETKVIKDGKDATEKYHAAVNGPEKTETSQKAAVKMKANNVGANGTYAFVYRENGHYYALGLDKDNHVAGLEVSDTIPEKVEWVLIKNKTFETDAYLLYNKQIGYQTGYLRDDGSGLAVGKQSAVYGKCHIEENGAIRTDHVGRRLKCDGSHVGYSDGYANTAFVPYHFNGQSATVTDNRYTISIAAKQTTDVPPTGLRVDRSAPAVMLLLGVCLGVFLVADYIRRKQA